MRKKKFTPRSALVLLCVLPVVGCGHYGTSSRTAKDIKSIYVPFFTNETTEPGLDISVTEIVINDLIDDNTLKVVDENNADAVLEGSIIRWVNKPFSFDNDLNAQEYRVIIHVRVSLFRRGGREAIWKDRTISGESSYFVEPIPGENTFQDARDAAVHTITERILGMTVQDW